LSLKIRFQCLGQVQKLPNSAIDVQTSGERTGPLRLTRLTPLTLTSYLIEREMRKKNEQYAKGRQCCQGRQSLPGAESFPLTNSTYRDSVQL
jgi:hypothetical protein